jgi:hypothetical protein
LEDIELLKRRTRVGALVAAGLGIIFGQVPIIAGSLITWQSDPVLGIYTRSGLHYKNLTGGDGIITLVFGIVGLIALVLGAIFVRKTFFAMATACAVFVFFFSMAELIILSTRNGVVAPGHGLYTVFGCTVAAFLCGMGGYLMTSERDAKLRALPSTAAAEA